MVFAGILFYSNFRRRRRECEEGVDLGDMVFDTVVQQGWKLRELRQEKKSLEDVFVELTGKEDPAPDPAVTARGTARGIPAA